MPIFDTPESISVTIEIAVGDVQITASDRTDTIVEVRSSNESDESDVKAAEQTRVEYADGALLVKTPKARALDFSRKSRSVDVSIDLPTGSQVYGDAAVADLRCSGRLGECRFKTSTGHIQLDRTGPLRLDTAGGHVAVDHVVGNAEVTTGSGRIRLGEIDGAAVVKNSNGNTEIGMITGEVQVRAANGDISINHALGLQVDAKTANGSIRIGEVVCGAVVLKTAMGDLEVGIGEGTAAWLEVNTGYGRVRNSLDDNVAGPGPSDETAEVRAHTSYGDITIRRS
jgi:DUF4097 and DUF4098 domain-containing protein YvlB